MAKLGKFHFAKCSRLNEIRLLLNKILISSILNKIEKLLIGDNCCEFVISKGSELHHSIGSLIDRVHPGPKTDRGYLGRYCPYETLKRQRAEYYKGEKERWLSVGVVAQWQSTGGLSQRPWGSGTTFLSLPLPFQRSTDSNGPDTVNILKIRKSKVRKLAAILPRHALKIRFIGRL